jgi:tRNA1(Val) A37 N6-methylase TrmN6
MIHRPERIADIFELMRKYKIEPKEIRFVCSNKDTSPKMVLIKGVKNGKSFLKVRENLYIYNKAGSYTDEILKIYNKI